MFLRTISIFIISALCLHAFEMPDATQIIKKDLLAPAKKFVMPKNCVTSNEEAVARGSYIFHNLNGKSSKENPPKGLKRKNPDGSLKHFGNCVACHNTINAVGPGNIGVDLSNYNTMFVKTNIRDSAFIYQKIADPRVDFADTIMTVNLTNSLMSEREICDIVSYILSNKNN